MRTTISLAFRCAGAGNAKKLEAALTPDNRGVPKDQKFSMKREGAGLVISISSERAPSAFTTANSLLVDANLFQEVLLASSHE